jgi:hypothetical protein
MGQFRVPYPEDPQRRRDLFERAVAVLSRHGTYEGTPERGSFRGTTPIGGFAGHYRAVAGAPELEITLTEKPWLVTTHMIEREVRKLMV